MNIEPLPSGVASLSRAELLRDFGTNSHERRSALMVHQIGVALDLAGQQCRMIAVASLLHDIGKIAVPIDLLQKSTPLTKEEVALIRTHCRRGHEILRSTVDPLMALASDIALHHHERYDGSGYPDGLVGAEIPLAVQIAAICDSYDALRQNRPYRPGLPHAAAMSIIIHGDGRTRPEHFSPLILQAFRDVGEMAQSIFDGYTPEDHIVGVMS